MLHRIERKDASGMSLGYYWAGSLKEAKLLRWECLDELRAEAEYGGRDPSGFTVGDFRIESFETPRDKTDWMILLNEQCAYPDNG